MIDTTTAMYTTVVIAVICLIYSAVMVVVKKLFSRVDEDYKKIKTGVSKSSYDDKEAFLATLVMGADLRARSFQDACQRVFKETMTLYTYQSISMVIVAALFSISFLIWFSITDQYVWFLIPFLLGCIVTAINTLLVLVLSTNSRPRALFSAQQEKEAAFAEGFILNIAIVSGVLGLYFLQLLLVVPVIQSWYFDSFAEKDNAKNFLFNTLAFAVGSCLSSIFYRDLGSNFSKGITIGSETLEDSLKDMKSTEASSAHNNLKYGEMIGNSFSSNVTSTLDLQNLIASLIVATMILTQAKDNQNETVLYIVLFLLSISTIVTLAVSWLSKLLVSSFKGTATSQYVASQIRVQYIVINIICFLLLFLLPVELIPAKLSIGTDGAKTPSFFDSEISRGDLVWCLQIGQFISFVLVFLTEVWTSYGFSLVRRISSKLTSQSLSDGAVAAETQGGYAVSLFVLFLGFSLFLAYYFGGVFGLNWVTIGVLQTAPMLLGVGFFSTSTNDAITLASLNALDQLCNRLRLINWASNNFASFIQLLNIAGGFFINLLCVAVIIYQSEAQKLTSFNGSSLLGLLLGFVLVFLLRSINANAIQNICNSLIENSKLVKLQKFNNSSLSSLNELVSQKFTPSFFSTLISILAVIAVDLFAAMILGKQAVIGLALGLAIFGTITSLNQLIVGTSLKNAQNFVDQSAMISGEPEVKRIISSPRESGFFAHVLHQVPGTGVINYIHFAVLLLVIGASTFKGYGYLDSYMQESSSDVSGATVDWYIDLVSDDSK